MAIQTFSEYLKQKEPTTKKVVSSKNKVTSFADYIKTSPIVSKPKTLGEKVVDTGKEIAKAIVSPVATMVARPVQLGAMLAGVSTENIDKFTMGGLIAPTPKSGKDVLKDVGRGIETVALGIPATKATKLFGNTIKPISSAVAPAMIGASKLTPKAVKTANVLSKSVGMGTEGAVFGYGQGLEQTGEPLGAETLKTTAMGAGIGAVLPIAGAGLSKVFGKKPTTGITNIVNKTDDVVNKATPEQPIVNKTETPNINTQTETQGFKNIPYKERTQILNKFDNQHIEDVVFNGKTPEGGLSKEMYISHLYDKAKLPGNEALLERLSTSKIVTDIESQAGQNLGALAQAERGTIRGIIKDAHNYMREKLPTHIIKGETKAVEKIQSQIKEVVDKFTDKSLTIEEKLSALDILKCK